MQAVAQKSSFDAMQRSIASSLAQDIIERMRNNSNANILCMLLIALMAQER
jgi:type IV pilus assembly protein PilV